MSQLDSAGPHSIRRHGNHARKREDWAQFTNLGSSLAVLFSRTPRRTGNIPCPYSPRLVDLDSSLRRYPSGAADESLSSATANLAWNLALPWSILRSLVFTRGPVVGDFVAWRGFSTASRLRLTQKPLLAGGSGFESRLRHQFVQRVAATSINGSATSTAALRGPRRVGTATIPTRQGSQS